MAKSLCLVGLLVAGASAGVFDAEPRVTLEGDVTAAVGAAPNWNRASRAWADEMVHPIFMLRHDADRLRSFEKTLMEVSTPGSPRYGQHLSQEEVERQLPATEGAAALVLAWLQEHGVGRAEIDAGSDMIAVTMKVATAEAMFGTEFHHFEHKTHGVDIIRASAAYSVPSSIASRLYLVGNLLQLPALPGVQKVALNETAPTDFPNGCGSKCAGKVTPAVLQQAYGFPAGPVPSGAKTSMAVAEFQGVSWDTKSLDYFGKTCNLPEAIKVDRQVGTDASWICKIPVIGEMLCLEALLDVQYIKAVAGDVPLTCISNYKYSLLNWAKELETMKDTPLVHSVSYGNDEVQQTSGAFMDSVNAQFMKLGAKGLSLLVASGDQGVYGRTGATSDGKFHPDFPAGSPYVTSVGGTDFAVKSKVGEEKAWTSGGGGFSDHFAAPSYQQAAVNMYLTAAGHAGKLPAEGHFNRAGRGYPDVAALGGQQNPYCVAASAKGIFETMVGVAGTSASCPVVAGLIARLNAARAEKGKAPMGFLNPFLYQNADAFNDVTLGVNNGAGSEGFAALDGWDPATGLGTPNFPKLQSAAMAASSEAHKDVSGEKPEVVV